MPSVQPVLPLLASEDGGTIIHERLENVHEPTQCGIFGELKNSAAIPRCEPQTSQRQKSLARLLSAFAENFLRGRKMNRFRHMNDQYCA
jgi:hypothetical protein